MAETLEAEFQIDLDIMNYYFDTFTSVSDIEELKIEVLSDGWEITSVDGAHVVMITTTIPERCFDYFDPEGMEGKVFQLMPRRLDIDEEFLKVDRFKLVHLEPGEDSYHKEEHVEKYVNDEEQPWDYVTSPNVPDMDFDIDFTIDSSDLDDAIDIMNSMTESMGWVHLPGVGMFLGSGKGDEVDTAYYVPVSNVISYNAGKDLGGYVVFLSEHIDSVKDHIDGLMRVQYSEDIPIRFTWTPFDIPDCNPEMSLMIVPRITDRDSPLDTYLQLIDTGIDLMIDDGVRRSTKRNIRNEMEERGFESRSIGCLFSGHTRSLYWQLLLYRKFGMDEMDVEVKDYGSIQTYAVDKSKQVAVKGDHGFPEVSPGGGCISTVYVDEFRNKMMEIRNELFFGMPNEENKIYVADKYDAGMMTTTFSTVHGKGYSPKDEYTKFKDALGRAGVKSLAIIDDPYSLKKEVTDASDYSIVLLSIDDSGLTVALLKSIGGEFEVVKKIRPPVGNIDVPNPTFTLINEENFSDLMGRVLKGTDELSVELSPSKLGDIRPPILSMSIGDDTMSELIFSARNVTGNLRKQYNKIHGVLDDLGLRKVLNRFESDAKQMLTLEELSEEEKEKYIEELESQYITSYDLVDEGEDTEKIDLYDDSAECRRTLNKADMNYVDKKILIKDNLDEWKEGYKLGLKHGSAKVFDTSDGWVCFGDTTHHDKDVIDYNLLILRGLYKEYKHLFDNPQGAGKDSDTHYAYIYTSQSEDKPDVLPDYIRVHSKMFSSYESWNDSIKCPTWAEEPEEEQEDMDFKKWNFAPEEIELQIDRVSDVRKMSEVEGLSPGEKNISWQIKDRLDHYYTLDMTFGENGDITTIEFGEQGEQMVPLVVDVNRMDGLLEEIEDRLVGGKVKEEPTEEKKLVKDMEERPRREFYQPIYKALSDEGVDFGGAGGTRGAKKYNIPNYERRDSLYKLTYEDKMLILQISRRGGDFSAYIYPIEDEDWDERWYYGFDDTELSIREAKEYFDIPITEKLEDYDEEEEQPDMTYEEYVDKFEEVTEDKSNVLYPPEKDYWKERKDRFIESVRYHAGEIELPDWRKINIPSPPDYEHEAGSKVWIKKEAVNDVFPDNFEIESDINLRYSWSWTLGIGGYTERMEAVAKVQKNGTRKITEEESRMVTEELEDLTGYNWYPDSVSNFVIHLANGYTREDMNWDDIEVIRAEDVEEDVLEWSDFDGRTIKQLDVVDSSAQRYHNKHKDGSGNFGYTIIDTNDNRFSMDGEYNSDKEITELKFGEYGQAGTHILSDVDDVDDLLEIIKFGIEKYRESKGKPPKDSWKYVYETTSRKITPTVYTSLNNKDWKENEDYAMYKNQYLGTDKRLGLDYLKDNNLKLDMTTETLITLEDLADYTNQSIEEVVEPLKDMGERKKANIREMLHNYLETEEDTKVTADCLDRIIQDLIERAGEYEPEEEELPEEHYGWELTSWGDDENYKYMAEHPRDLEEDCPEVELYITERGYDTKGSPMHSNVVNPEGNYVVVSFGCNKEYDIFTPKDLFGRYGGVERYTETEQLQRAIEKAKEYMENHPSFEYWKEKEVPEQPEEEEEMAEEEELPERIDSWERLAKPEERDYPAWFGRTKTDEYDYAKINMYVTIVEGVHDEIYLDVLKEHRNAKVNVYPKVYSDPRDHLPVRFVRVELTEPQKQAKRFMQEISPDVLGEYIASEPTPSEAEYVEMEEVLKKIKEGAGVEKLEEEVEEEEEPEKPPRSEWSNLYKAHPDEVRKLPSPLYETLRSEFGEENVDYATYGRQYLGIKKRVGIAFCKRNNLLLVRTDDAPLLDLDILSEYLNMLKDELVETFERMDERDKRETRRTVKKVLKEEKNVRPSEDFVDDELNHLLELVENFEEAEIEGVDLDEGDKIRILTDEKRYGTGMIYDVKKADERKRYEVNFPAMDGIHDEKMTISIWSDDEDMEVTDRSDDPEEDIKVFVSNWEEYEERYEEERKSWAEERIRQEYDMPVFPTGSFPEYENEALHELFEEWLERADRREIEEVLEDKYNLSKDRLLADNIASNPRGYYSILRRQASKGIGFKTRAFEPLIKEYFERYYKPEVLGEEEEEEAEEEFRGLKLERGDKITHDKFGVGMVYRYDESNNARRYQVNFPGETKKKGVTMRIWSYSDDIELKERAENPDKAISYWYDNWQNIRREMLPDPEFDLGDAVEYLGKKYKIQEQQYDDVNNTWTYNIITPDAEEEKREIQEDELEETSLKEEKVMDKDDWPYLYKSEKRPVPTAFWNELEKMAEKVFDEAWERGEDYEYYKDNREIGSTHPLPSNMYEDYELTLVRTGEEPPFSLKDIADFVGVPVEKVAEFFSGRAEGFGKDELLETIGRYIKENGLGHRAKTEEAFRYIQTQAKDFLGEDIAEEKGEEMGSITEEAEEEGVEKTEEELERELEEEFRGMLDISVNFEQGVPDKSTEIRASVKNEHRDEFKSDVHTAIGEHVEAAVDEIRSNVMTARHMEEDEEEEEREEVRQEMEEVLQQLVNPQIATEDKRDKLRMLLGPKMIQVAPDIVINDELHEQIGVDVMIDQTGQGHFIIFTTIKPQPPEWFPVLANEGNRVTYKLPVRADISRPFEALEDYKELVRLIDSRNDFHPRVTDKIHELGRITVYDIRKRRAKINKVVLNPDEEETIGKISIPFLEMVTKDYMPDLSSALLAAQKMHLCSRGDKKECRIIKQSIAQEPTLGGKAWYIEKAYMTYENSSDFNPQEFVYDWHAVADPSQTYTAAEIREFDRTDENGVPIPPKKKSIIEDAPEPMFEEGDVAVYFGDRFVKILDKSYIPNKKRWEYEVQGLEDPDYVRNPPEKYLEEPEMSQEEIKQELELEEPEPGMEVEESKLRGEADLEEEEVRKNLMATWKNLDYESKNSLYEDYFDKSMRGPQKIVEAQMNGDVKRLDTCELEEFMGKQKKESITNEVVPQNLSDVEDEEDFVLKLEDTYPNIYNYYKRICGYPKDRQGEDREEIIDCFMRSIRDAMDEFDTFEELGQDISDWYEKEQQKTPEDKKDDGYESAMENLRKKKIVRMRNVRDDMSEYDKAWAEGWNEAIREYKTPEQYYESAYVKTMEDLEKGEHKTNPVIYGDDETHQKSIKEGITEAIEDFNQEEETEKEKEEERLSSAFNEGYSDAQAQLQGGQSIDRYSDKQMREVGPKDSAYMEGWNGAIEDFEPEDEEKEGFQVGETVIYYGNEKFEVVKREWNEFTEKYMYDIEALERDKFREDIAPKYLEEA